MSDSNKVEQSTNKAQQKSTNSMLKTVVCAFFQQTIRQSFANR
ncbi:hypothetical protein GMES_0939 [Paraglaciecola mesophila KMM 241]|uniref:Uncharacterized protein n=1 Tax=Paraglaciecola mesophila KMM 241 TaxID=1128912 RepID=K6Z2M2_9ALTE|nr:hypothetical protein GMES_0939 [Paraglaciecola mesophila KMM 241]